MGVEVTLLKGSLNQLILASQLMKDLPWQGSISMNLVNVDLALLDLPLKLLVNFVLVNNTPKSLLNLLASLHDLPLYQLVIHSTALRELHQNCVLLVHSMELPVLNVKEGPLPLAVGALSLPKSPLL